MTFSHYSIALKARMIACLILKLQIFYTQDTILSIHSQQYYTHCCFVTFLMNYAYKGKILTGTWKYHPTLKIQWCTIHIFYCVFLSNEKSIAKITSYSMDIFQKCFIPILPFLAMLKKPFSKPLVNCIWPFCHKTLAFGWCSHSVILLRRW